jgi:hypothetical protein
LFQSAATQKCLQVLDDSGILFGDIICFAEVGFQIVEGRWVGADLDDFPIAFARGFLRFEPRRPVELVLQSALGIWQKSFARSVCSLSRKLFLLIFAKKTGWTAIYVQHSIRFMERIGHKI